MGHLEFLLFQDVVPVDGVHDFVFGSLNPAVDQGTAFFFIEGFTGKQVVHDACGGKPERVCQDTVDPDAGNQNHYPIRDYIVTSAEMMKIIQEGE